MPRLHRANACCSLILLSLTLLAAKAHAQVNLWDPTAVASGYLSGADGAFNPALDIVLSSFIPVTPGATYTSSHGLIINIAGLCFYDFGRVLQSCFSAGFEHLRNRPATFTVPSSPAPAFIRLSLAASDNDTEQLIAGSNTSASPATITSPIPAAAAATALTTGPLSHLAGKNVMFIGDSLSSQFGNKWQQAFIDRTGAVYYGQDAAPGALSPRSPLSAVMNPPPPPITRRNAAIQPAERSVSTAPGTPHEPATRWPRPSTT